MNKRHVVRTVLQVVKWNKLVAENSCKTNQSKVSNINIRTSVDLPWSEQPVLNNSVVLWSIKLAWKLKTSSEEKQHLTSQERSWGSLKGIFIRSFIGLSGNKNYHKVLYEHINKKDKQTIKKLATIKLSCHKWRAV